MSPSNNKSTGIYNAIIVNIIKHHRPYAKQKLHNQWHWQATTKRSQLTTATIWRRQKWQENSSSNSYLTRKEGTVPPSTSPTATGKRATNCLPWGFQRRPKVENLPPEPKSKNFIITIVFNISTISSINSSINSSSNKYFCQRSSPILNTCQHREPPLTSKGGTGATSTRFSHNQIFGLAPSLLVEACHGAKYYHHQSIITLITCITPKNSKCDDTSSPPASKGGVHIAPPYTSKGGSNTHNFQDYPHHQCPQLPKVAVSGGFSSPIFGASPPSKKYYYFFLISKISLYLSARVCWFPYCHARICAYNILESRVHNTRTIYRR